MSSFRLTQDRSTAVFQDDILYGSIVGALQYVTITRLEITYFVYKVCQYMRQPQQHE